MKVTSCSVLRVAKKRTPSKHYVYEVQAGWQNGTKTLVYRRYSDFFNLHMLLADMYPFNTEQGKYLPSLPGKNLFGRNSSNAIVISRIGLLDAYLKALVASPSEISASPLCIDFFSSTKFDLDPVGLEFVSADEGPLPIMSLSSLSSSSVRRGSKEEIVGVNSKDGPLDLYRAVSPYAKQNNSELSFKTGEKFEVIEKNDNGWWFVVSTERADLQGWVPATYLESVHVPTEEEHQNAIPTKDERQYMAESRYEARAPDEIGLDPGAVVNVLEKHLDGWWKIEHQGREGWAPGALLSPVERAGSPSVVSVVSNGSSGNRSSITSSDVILRRVPLRRTEVPRPESIHGDKGLFAFAFRVASPHRRTKYITLASYESSINDCVGFSAGVEVSLIEKADSGWWFIEVDGKRGWAPSEFLKPVELSLSNPNSSSPKLPSVSLRSTDSNQSTKSASGSRPPPPRPQPPKMNPQIATRPSQSSPPLPQRKSNSTLPTLHGSSSLHTSRSDTTSPTSSSGSKPNPPKPPTPSTTNSQPSRPPPPTKPTAGPNPPLRPARPSQPFSSSSVSAGKRPLPTVPNPQPGSSPSTPPLSPPSQRPSSGPSRPPLPQKGSSVLGTTQTQSRSANSSPSPRVNQEKLVVVADYAKTTEAEISVKEGEVVSLVEKNDSGWSFVISINGSQGWVPSDYLDPTPSSGNGGGSSEPYTVGVSCGGAYVGAVPRNTVEEVMHAKARDGEYVVRESETTAGNFTITMKIAGQIHHFRVSKNQGKFSIGELEFNTLNEVISWYKIEPIYASEGLTATLGNPFKGNMS